MDSTQQVWNNTFFKCSEFLTKSEKTPQLDFSFWILTDGDIGIRYLFQLGTPNLFHTNKTLHRELIQKLHGVLVLGHLEDTADIFGLSAITKYCQFEGLMILPPPPLIGTLFPPFFYLYW